MKGIVDWAAARTRMTLVLVVLALVAGATSYISIPKEAAPDIDIPVYYVSVPYPGISAEDSERMLVEPLERTLSTITGLKEMFGIGAENYAAVSLVFDFGLNRDKTLADLRDLVSQVEADLPPGAESPVINEVTFSQFPIISVALAGEVPERTLLRLADDLKEQIEALEPILEVGVTGERAEMLEVLIDPLKLEAYDISADELIGIFQRNNQLIAAGEVTTRSGAFALKIPSSFSLARDIYQLPVKVNGDRVVVLGDLVETRLAFEDRTGFARHNGSASIALQVVKRKGFNIIDTVRQVRETVDEERATWPPEINNAVVVEFVQDSSINVTTMIKRLESSVITAIALVMIVVLATLGTRSALLVGFSIPASFMLCFLLLGLADVAISNIVMFGLILAVGMLVDSSIIIVELADRRISEGDGPMEAYANAAKRMFWPIVSSTATTLCAFLPMLFWPGVAGQFMGTLPVTLIFVLSASLLVALVFLPVVGGMSGRAVRVLNLLAAMLRRLPLAVRLLALAATAAGLFGAALLTVNPTLLPMPMPPTAIASLPGALLFSILCVIFSILVGSIKPVAAVRRRHRRPPPGRTFIGMIIRGLVGNPIMPLVSLGVIVALVAGIVGYYMKNNYGVQFFVDAEPERTAIFVRARGNLSIEQMDELVRQAEGPVLAEEGISSVFAFAGDSGLRDDGANKPGDAVGELRAEFAQWEDRQAIGGAATDARDIIAGIEERLESLPGIFIDISSSSSGPQSSKPVHLRLMSRDWDDLLTAGRIVRQRFDDTVGLAFVEDSLPLPGIDWQINVDLEKAGRYGADVAAVGGMAQLITRGILLDTMRIDSSDDEIDVILRLPEEDRLLSTLDQLKLRTNQGLVPLSNFVERVPVRQLESISRVDKYRYLDIKADVRFGLTNDDGKRISANERIMHLTEWLENEAVFPRGVEWKWTGDQEEQNESQEFLMKAFVGALGLIFVVLLAQFNSIYNAVLVLIAVILSTVGVLIGMLVMKQTFSMIMTGTGIVALAGIVVNNNIVLIDTYQEYSKFMPRIQAIIRTVEVRMRPVMLTTVTTVAGLTPMMFGIAFDLADGGYTIDTPSALWWKFLATAVVFGLATATVLTLICTPALLALPVWIAKGSYGVSRLVSAIALGKSSRSSRDRQLARRLRAAKAVTLRWDEGRTDDWNSAPPSTDRQQAPS